MGSNIDNGSCCKCLFIKRVTFHIEKSGYDGDILRNANLLQSFFYCDDFTEKVIIPQSRNFMLDSGAFTFLSSKGGKVNWEKYIRRYAEFIKRNNVDLFFELDIDSIVGYEKVLYYRSMIEQLTGKPCIPVWHVSRGKDEFIKMCRSYDYVAFGGLITDGVSRSKINKVLPWFIRTAHVHGAKIHGLGYTSLKDLPRVHFDSVDSTAWLSGGRFGTLYQFNGRTLVRHNGKKGQRLIKGKAAAVHNFKEWLKFAEYAEKYL